MSKVLIVAALLCISARAGAQRTQVLVQGFVGTIHYPSKEWRPTPTAGLNGIVFLPRNFSILLLAARDVKRGSKMVYAVELQKVLWSKKGKTITRSY